MDIESAKRRNACRHAYRLACHIADDLESYSKIIDRQKEDALPRFDRDEVILGNLLGTGSFNNVFELSSIDLLDEEDLIVSNEQKERRMYMSKLTNERVKQYAIKFLTYDLLDNNFEDYCNGAADLVVESKILSSLKSHRNVIQIYGMTDMDGLAEDSEGSYFLILDRLNDTLDNRLITWKEKYQHITNMNTMNGNKRRNGSVGDNDIRRGSDNNDDDSCNLLLLERLGVAYELACALKHLHKYNIIFRDLKPDNVGFDVNGTLKLFDFGLAKELNPKQKVTDEEYDMSGQTGSGRYMAPEVVLSKPYGLSADVFSFGILFWQICSMEEPFELMTLSDHLKFVVNGTWRPKIYDELWPDRICKIMKKSWVGDQTSRPTMKQICKAFKREIEPDNKNDNKVLVAQHSSKNLIEKVSEKFKELTTTVSSNDDKNNNASTNKERHQTTSTTTDVITKIQVQQQSPLTKKESKKNGDEVQKQQQKKQELQQHRQQQQRSKNLISTVSGKLQELTPSCHNDSNVFTTNNKQHQQQQTITAAIKMQERRLSTASTSSTSSTTIPSLIDLYGGNKYNKMNNNKSCNNITISISNSKSSNHIISSDNVKNPFLQQKRGNGATARSSMCDLAITLTEASINTTNHYDDCSAIKSSCQSI